MAQLTNTARVDADYGDTPIHATSGVVVNMPELTMIKTADKTEWLDDVLTYTVLIRNIEDADTGQTAETVVFTDSLDLRYVTLIAGSVKLDGSDVAYTFDEFGKLTVNLPDLDPTESATITFRVRKV